jgi:RNA polymerase sigma-70 factor, ECF subfamily
MSSAAQRRGSIEAETIAPAAVSPRERTAALFNEHGRYVWRVLRRLGVADADVEDVCQEVFLTAHRKLANFEARSSSRTWLYGICLRLAANYRRKTGRRPSRLLGSDPEGSAPETADARMGLVDLDWALSGLSEVKRTVFVLYEFGELSMAEISELVGSPIKTCFSRLHAARCELRKVLTTESEKVR